MDGTVIMTYHDIVKRTWQLEKELTKPNHYANVLGMTAVARYAMAFDDQEMLADLKEYITPYINGAFENAGGVFGKRCYCIGGNATAFLYKSGLLDEAEDILRRYVEMLYTEQGRDSAGYFNHHRVPQKPENANGALWIDTCFGVCPFMMWLGQAFNEQKYIDDAVHQMKGHHRLLFNTEAKLYHQAINFNDAPNQLTAFWGRGEGWGVYTLTELVSDLGKDHPDYEFFKDALIANLEGCLAVQDADGMFHQVLDMPESFVESSSTCLIIYAMGRAVEMGLVDKDIYTAAIVKAINGLKRYIALDGSIHHCCVGCLCPNLGRPEDYAAWRYLVNDTHAFGPVILALGQAAIMEKAGLLPAF